jgi:hypothetical protein
MKKYRGEGRCTSIILNFCPGRFTPRERAPGSHWLSETTGRFGEEENDLFLPGFQHPIVQP